MDITLRLAVTDACIFIDLLDLDLTSSFFGLDLEVHTTREVMDELFSGQQEILKAYQTVGKLTVHNLASDDLLAIQATNYPKALSQQDKSVIHLANQIDAVILSSDGAVRKYAQRAGLEIHGIFWIFDQLVDQQLLDKQVAITKLNNLMDGNLMYRNNPQLQKEANLRIRKWNDD
ncbi:MAG: hypothetical protein ACFB15_20730 [Cyclobacteriaceae bacterium]